jgi:hypothetical protein
MNNHQMYHAVFPVLILLIIVYIYAESTCTQKNNQFRNKMFQPLAQAGGREVQYMFVLCL